MIYKYIVLLCLLVTVNAKSFFVVNGNSYHHNVNNFNYCGNDCNENNWGVGIEIHKDDLVYSIGTFLDSWGDFSWYGGIGREYKINKFIRPGFSLGIMNKNYSINKQITMLYLFPLVILHITDSIAINITIIPSSNLFKDWTAGHEWPTTLFFQYKFKIKAGNEV